MKKDKLLNLVADLVEMLVDSGAKKDILIHTLKYYGLTDNEIADWYGLEIWKPKPLELGLIVIY